MDILAQIRKPVEKELQRFSSFYEIHLQHPNRLLQRALDHVRSRKGKLMRPILTLLSAKRYGEIGDSVLHAAVSFEMLHNASLIHDDVVDESDRRRAQKSVNSLFDNKVAVLFGDYLLSTSLQHAAHTQNIQVVSRVASLGQTLSDGELLQLSNLSSDEISENQCFDVIKGKTSALFAVCASVGALLSGANADETDKMRCFGENIGCCFQIRDDIFDYFNDNVGKPTGLDMKEGKLTLPVVHAVLQSNDDKWLKLALKVRSHQANDDEIASLVQFTKTSGGIDYAFSKMEQIRSRALSLLEPHLNDEIDHSLHLYLDFVLQRNW